MCGIAGAVCLTNPGDREDLHGLVAGMCDVQHHRGPDDSGVETVGRVVFGSNRLSIIDLSSAGHMPMTNEARSWWIVYNGEIFNFQELRDELRELGYQFRSRTDTEVVLHAFKEWGPACLERFTGMFGLAIYDRQQDCLILARDRFGKKPLYYAQRSGRLYFASEMKAMLPALGELRPNQQRLAEWSLYRNVDFGSPDTLIEGVLSLPPGHYMMIREGRVEAPRRYYSAESQIDASVYGRLRAQPVEKTVNEIEQLVVAAVKDRLVSDVPVGTLCSGGIDSSLVTALAASEIRDITAFNVSVVGYEEIDENRYARMVTDKLGLKLLTLPMVPEMFRENLPRAIYHSDAPLTHPNSVAFLLVSEFARGHGVKILLSGEAADELFGGYMQRYRRYRQILTLRKLASYLPGKLRRTVSLVGYAFDGIPVTAFSEYSGLLQHATSFLDRYSREDLRLRCLDAYKFVEKESERAVLAAMLADITNFLTPLLRRLDRMSMAASVEARAPFMDHRLVSTVLNLPLSLRLRGKEDKWILKQVAARYLPNQVVFRKKVGFPLPLGDYIGPLADVELFKSGFCVNYLDMQPTAMLDAVVNWRANVNGFFNLLALELWGRLFFMRQGVGELTERWCLPAGGRQTAIQGIGAGGQVTTSAAWSKPRA